MLLLPGLNSELADEIIAYRLRDDINTRSELGEIIPFENLAELSTWVGNETSSFYSVFVSMRNEIDSVQEVMLERAAEGKFDPLSYNTNFEEYLSDDKYFRDIMSETFVDGSAVNQGLVYDRQAYMEIIEVNNFNQLPRVYKVDPYGRLPTVLVLSSEVN
jgi:general secretion pathway protein K